MAQFVVSFERSYQVVTVADVVVEAKDIRDVLKKAEEMLAHPENIPFPNDVIIPEYDVLTAHKTKEERA